MAFVKPFRKHLPHEHRYRHPFLCRSPSNPSHNLGLYPHIQAFRLRRLRHLHSLTFTFVVNQPTIAITIKNVHELLHKKQPKNKHLLNSVFFLLFIGFPPNVYYRKVGVVMKTSPSLKKTIMRKKAKDSVFALRISSEHLDQIRRKAAEKGLDASSFARMVLIEQLHLTCMDTK
jgi:hypothetical protein